MFIGMDAVIFLIDANNICFSSKQYLCCVALAVMLE